MEKIEDMIILEYLPLQKVRVRCSICGKERIVSLRNLRRKGNRHTINTCKESFVNLLIGKELGDYVVSGSAPKNKIELSCKICGHKTSCYESGLTPRFHNGSTCKEDFAKSFLGKSTDAFKIVDYFKKEQQYQLVLECLSCATRRNIPINKIDTYSFSHKDCFYFLPNDNIKKTISYRWEGINQRVFNPNNNNYTYYGARGVQNKFKDKVDFYYHFYPELSKNPFLTIDRIDVNGDYSKENTRLITIKEQQSNKRETHYFIAQAGDKCYVSNNTMEFGKRFGINGRSIGNCLRGQSKTAGGFKFKEITKEQFENLCSVTTKGIIVIQEVVGGIPTL